MMMQGDPADKPRLKAQAYSDEQMEEHKAKDRWGLPSSFIGIAMSEVVIIVQHALCLAVTLGVGGVFALKEFLAHSAHSFSHNCSFRLNVLLVFSSFFDKKVFRAVRSKTKMFPALYDTFSVLLASLADFYPNARTKYP